MLQRVPTRWLAAGHLGSRESLFKGFLTPTAKDTLKLWKVSEQIIDDDQLSPQPMNEYIWKKYML